MIWLKSSKWIILLLCFDTVFAVDLTLHPGATGPSVVLATIAKLDNAFSHENPFWDIRQSTFMRTLAFVESEDGVGESLSQGFDLREGIWRVRIGVLISGKLMIETLDRGIAIRDEITSNGIIEWNSIFNLDNMEIPLYCCIAARLFLLFSSDIPDVIPPDCSSQSDDILDLNSIEIINYWHQCYHQGDSAIDRNDYPMRYQQLLMKNENGIDCNIDIDLSFVLDSSGSIESENWELVRQYVTNVVNSINANQGNRVAIIRYSSNFFVDISLNSDQSDLSSVINDMEWLAGGTNTAAALLQLINQPWRRDALRIAIVMTDGRSNDGLATLLAVEQIQQTIQMPSLIFFVVGVANYVLEEVMAIATSNDTISFIENFNTEDLTNTFERQSHQICFSVSSMVEVGNGDSLKYQEFLQSETIRLTYEIPGDVGLTIRLCVEEGHARLYGSFFIPNPNPAFHDFILDSITHGQLCEDIYILADSEAPGIGRKRRQVSESLQRVIFVSIEGIADNSSFSVESDSGNTVQYSVTCAQNPCGNNSVCTNSTLGGYSCDCLPGFVFGPDAINCQDINECDLSRSPCNPFASCSNLIGSVECTCLPGYYGNGFKCVIEYNTELRLIVSVVCGVVGGIILLVAVAAAIISIYVSISANKSSRFHQKDGTSRPADPNLNFSGGSQTNLFSVDILY